LEQDYNLGMRRTWLVGACLILSTAMLAGGQRGGGFRGGAGFHGGSFAPRGGMHRGGFAGAGHPFRGSGGFHRPGRGPRIIIGGFQHGRGFRRGFYPYGAYPYSGWYSPFLWDWENSSYDSGDRYRDAYADAQYQTTAEINRLANEVEQLREERASAPVEQAPPRPVAQPEARAEQDLPVILVFLDKHIQEIRNYAVANEMVVAFDGTRTRKYPLMDIDLAATMKLNDERGVNFDVPNPVMN
jgi:hypothetical protein